MILLVADLSDPIDELRDKIETSLEILSKIGAHNVPTLIVLNKLDLLDPDEASRKVEELDLELPYTLISAKFGYGLSNLERMVSEMLSGFIKVEASLPYDGNGIKILEEIYDKSKIFNVDFDDKSIKLKAETPIYLAEKLRRYAVGGSFKILG